MLSRVVLWGDVRYVERSFLAISGKGLDGRLC